MLVADASFPDLRQTIYVYDLTESVEFGSAVISEDAQVPVELAIYLDYGQIGSAGRPYRRAIYPFEPIPPGTLADGARSFAGNYWYPGDVTVEPGCHTVTLMASHAFDADVCPVESNDSSYLVWQVIRCQSSVNCDIACEPPTCDGPQACPKCPRPALDASSLGGQQ
ncbi:hypothetical protein [Chondromyces apiculatus]|uniref:hypothetical protein n=1 Tax=Chondromyces apiculatus TaxID=51 RepID=UPI0005C66FF0|nr:hypothetical protein [Chondromyces apiculatus]